MKLAIAWLILFVPFVSQASPLASPGDVLLRHDLELLNDAGVMNAPLTAWPVSLTGIRGALKPLPESAPEPVAKAYGRIDARLRAGLETGSLGFTAGVTAAVEPRFVRSFQNTPRDEGELSATLDWSGQRYFVRLSAAGVANPFDGDDVRLDDSYIGVNVGNWVVTAGWQERWWGPGRDASLIVSNNARPAPGIMLQRSANRPFESRWLSWLGPWTFTTFISELDDERVINDARLFGMRGSFRPPGTGLEIGIARTAQWCGNDRPCDVGVFGDLLAGNDNQGVNVDPDEEPGNQLGGFDIRWRLPRNIPAALYMQWVGEDGRGGGGAIGSWMRQAGIETWSTVGSLSHRTHFEVSDSMCREGGFGFSDRKPNCAYEHSIYATGYRYQGRSIGHSADADSLSYSIGSTLVQSAGHTWNVLLRHMKINRDDDPSTRHTVSFMAAELSDIQLTHERTFGFGRLVAGVGFSRFEDLSAGTTNTEETGFIQWSSN